MDKVYAPLKEHYLVYIDDVLIFNKSVEEHKQHLRRFQELTFEYGLALFETKMTMGIIDVDFLGLKIK